MDKRDLPIIIALFALLFAWPYVYKKFFAPSPGPAVEALAEPEGVGTPADEEEPAPFVALDVEGEVADGAERETPVAPDGEAEPVESAPDSQVLVASPDPVVRAPECRETLTNSRIGIVVSTCGAGIVSAQLNAFRETIEKDSSPVLLNFADAPALTYESLPGLGCESDFRMVGGTPGRQVILSRECGSGILFTRTITMGDGYQLDVLDRFDNTGEQPVAIPAHSLRAGPMRVIRTRSRMRGMTFIGVDALLSGGEGVRHWGRKKFLSGDLTLVDLFQAPNRRGGCVGKPKMQKALPVEMVEEQPVSTDWVAVKNKFFVQIISPDETGNGYVLHAKRVVPETETEDNRRSWAGMAEIEEAGTAIGFPERRLEAGQTFERRIEYYVGPKKYSILRDLDRYRAEVMNFGMWSPVCRILLRALNAVHAVVRNYGLAIIVLTILIRLVFWPITHKNSEHMRRMQEIQPLVKEIRQKHKDDAQRQQRETMALYKEHKLNPAMGCLPMLIQIPVFIALFRVLQSAVELRFATFLWIADLSEPEGLLAGAIPIVGSLNILPLFMSATMAWQQRLTPTAGDPNQQKMMMFMPIMMLVFFYNMPSALVLYWSTNQCLMIGQLLHQRRKKAAQPS